MPEPDPTAVGRHRQLAAAIAEGLVVSAHDPSEGGLAVAAAEWAFAGRRGLDLDIDSDDATLFGEGPGRYLVEVTPANAARFGEVVPAATVIGHVTDDQSVTIAEVVLTLDEIGRAWKQAP